jgi:hypothetical protein
LKQRENIKEKYEFIYGNVAEIVEAVIASSRVPAHQTYATLKRAVPAGWVLAIWMRQRQGAPTVEQQRDYVDAYLAEAAAWEEDGERKSGTRIDYMVSTDAFFAKTFAQRLTDCDLILDLGCGWGHRMVDVHLQGVNAQFVGGERSPHANGIIKALAALFPSARLGWFAFDFLNPDFSAVAATAKKIGVFSCHAIEQVEILGPALFDALLARFPDAELTGVHIEPISWQIDRSCTAEHAFAQRLQYNTDLLAVVQNHPSLRVTEVKSIIHNGYDHNPSSLLTWRHGP